MATVAKFGGDVDMGGNALLGVATAAAGNATQQAANTAFVTAAVAAALGGAHVIPLVVASVPVTTASLTDVVLAGSDFLWNSPYVPPGRAVYLEILGFGSLATLGVTATMYTLAGVAVTGSASTPVGLTGGLARSSALTLANGTTYQVRWKATLAGTASLRQARLIII